MFFPEIGRGFIDVIGKFLGICFAGVSGKRFILIAARGHNSAHSPHCPHFSGSHTGTDEKAVFFSYCVTERGAEPSALIFPTVTELPEKPSTKLKTSRIYGTEDFSSAGRIFTFPAFAGYIISRIDEKTLCEMSENGFWSASTASVSENSEQTLKNARSKMSPIFAFSFSAIFAASMT